MKSVLRAPVPAYCLDTASALSAQTDKETESDTEEIEQTEYLLSCKNTSCERLEDANNVIQLLQITIVYVHEQ